MHSACTSYVLNDTPACIPPLSYSNSNSSSSTPASPPSNLQPSPSGPPSPINHDSEGTQPQERERLSHLMPTTEESTGHCKASNLPNFEPMANPDFTWGELDATSFTKFLESAYEETVHWRKNCFRIPQGKAGKSFINELARQFLAFATGSALESVALKATTVLPLLVLQKSHRNSKAKDHIACLERRMKLWEEGNIEELVREGRAIQSRIPKHRPQGSEQQLARSFPKLMFQGKTHAALQLLTDKGKGGVLHLHDIINNEGPNPTTVKDVLKSKHPSSRAPTPDSMYQGKPPDVHPVTFEPIDASLIKSIALSTKGAAGPSGLDVHTWRRMCTSFKTASIALCHSLALTAKRLCTTLVDPRCTSPLLACRLIALDKNPGVRPIGIGETPRRIIAKAALSVTRSDIMDTAGSTQLCAGQVAGAEAAVHAVRQCFQLEGNEAVLLIDASNAFNSLNRNAALHNIRFECPAISTILINTYREPTELFIDGEVIYSQEGTTQGDPLAMPMYAVATIPLIKRLPKPATQIWYADDGSALGNIMDLREWWDELARLGPDYGYFPNSSKTWLVTKEEFHANAAAAFEGTNINVTSYGRPYLGAALGTSAYIDQFVAKKVAQWSDEVSLLTAIATTQPHAAYAAFTHGLSSKWSYLSRTQPSLSNHFEDLENTIRSEFIPTLTGTPPPHDSDRELFALPARLGGLGLRNPARNCDLEYSASKLISEPLVKLIVRQQDEYLYECLADQMTAKLTILQQRRQQAAQAAEHLKPTLSVTRRRAMDLASERGASNWLTALPIEEFGFSLHKGAFTDALALRYGWTPSRIPLSCDCGSTFTVEHVLSCPRGGFPTIRHNEVRDVTANLLTEICHDVKTEPDLQPLTGETMTRSTSITADGARLDIAVNGFWGGRFERTFLDVRVFNPHAPTNRNTTISNCYRKHEAEKKRAYEQRILEVEHSTFTPLVFSATGGMAKQCSTFYKRLASRLAEKWEQPYSSTLSWVRCRLSFSLLRSAIQCIRGARSSCGHASKPTPPIDLISSEAQLRPT